MEFRLLTVTPDRSSIILEDRYWSVTEPLDINSPADLPDYICISYVWGSGRVPNPIHPTVQMSDHTLPAVIAAIRNHDPDHSASMIWIDAFCVPIEPVAKRATLESMGFIYAHAKQVVVVLSNEAFMALEKTKQLDTAKTSSATVECLDILENNGWIRSVWTYQEVVNCQSMLFTGEGMAGKFVRGEDFLNRIGQYLYTWRLANDYSASKFREKYLYLDALENVVLDWKLSWYEKISSLQVICQMEHRTWEEPSNIFYSMIGTITSASAPRRTKPSVESLAETFMELCEKKGDYSFIYTSTERDKRPGYRWRPTPSILHSIVPWHCSGVAQWGEKDSVGIRLREVVILERSDSIGVEGREFVLSAAKANKDGQWSTDTALAINSYNMLQQLGFSGSKEYLVTTRGFFYPQWPILSAPIVVLWALTTITWRIAFPGMAIVLVDGERSYIPGVFIGSLPNTGPDEVIIENA